MHGRPRLHRSHICLPRYSVTVGLHPFVGRAGQSHALRHGRRGPQANHRHVASIAHCSGLVQAGVTWAAYRRGEDKSSIEDVFGNFFQLSIWAVFLQGMLQVQATLSNPLGRSTLAFPSRAFVRPLFSLGLQKNKQSKPPGRSTSQSATRPCRFLFRRRSTPQRMLRMSATTVQRRPDQPFGINHIIIWASSHHMWD